MTDSNVFQSTPVITDERIAGSYNTALTDSRFQSTPVITDERIFGPGKGLIGNALVSIHARHY